MSFKRWTGVVLVAMVATGCATGRAYVNGQNAQKAGDWDTAVAYYKEALSRSPNRIDVRIALQRASSAASQAHMARARQLELADQLPGAAAEYRMAADLDLTNTLAAAKSVELDRIIRQRIEDARPKSAMELMRDQVRKQSAIPTLAVDPRMPMPLLTFNKSAVRDVLTVIASTAGINVTYDTAGGVETNLSKDYTVTLQGVSLQDALNQVLAANNLFYKVVDPRTILVSMDSPANRGRLEDQVVQMFYLSHADAGEVVQSITTIMNQLNSIGVRPVPVANKTANSIMVRTSVAIMEVIERLIRSMDKPRAEVVIDVEILEVDRTQAASYGLNLSQYQLGFTFSPEAPPSATGGAPPFNLNTISQGISTADFYAVVPSAVIKALESDSRTKILARPSLRGTEGKSVTLNLGEQIPVPSTTFAPIAAGGVASQPTTSFTLKEVGVNVTMTPKVTYDNEIIIELSVENSAKAPDVVVAGTALPSFSSRKVSTTLRLRDGESNLLAGLIREEDKKSLQGLPWISKIPGLRALLGGTDKTLSTSDIVMLITPRIVRGHELTIEDLRPIYVGTSQNFGLSGAPALIATPPTAEELAAAGVGATPPGMTPPGTPPGTPAQTQAAAPPRNPVVVPITPVGQGTTTPPPAGTQPPPGASPVPPPPNLPPAPNQPPGTPAPSSTRTANIAMIIPAPLQAGGGPYTAPLQISEVTELGSIRIAITYDPKVLKARQVTQGTFLSSGGVTTTFTPAINESVGRVEILIGRPAGAAGVSGAGFLGAIVFDAISAGPANLTMTVSALTPAARPIAVNLGPLTVVVR